MEVPSLRLSNFGKTPERKDTHFYKSEEIRAWTIAAFTGLGIITGSIQVYNNYSQNKIEALSQDIEALLKHPTTRGMRLRELENMVLDIRAKNPKGDIVSLFNDTMGNNQLKFSAYRGPK